MHSKLSLAIISAAMLIAVRAAATTPRSPPSSFGGQCNTGSLRCCDTVGDASDPGIVGLVGDLLDGVSGLVGIGCSPVVGGDTCTNTPVCCENDIFAGLINIGCVAVNTNL
ncbi:fungal hydrophobin [Laetiporus sulphureus 93-53]|uniref:Hydrophobin n=1 Tax=Laetiporus sulphureus 93-53 TaxID=1314785 RepID=A0A165BYK3_9APHY|nr:fungal hydrophobin [Laetiporus sulphureus 93-53]KZT01884.1 fungal hydrophobin [Laetiporus sulphureus 93-53]